MVPDKAKSDSLSSADDDGWKGKRRKLWSLIDGAAVTAALQRTRAYYSLVDDLTQFDLHILQGFCIGVCLRID